MDWPTKTLEVLKDEPLIVKNPKTWDNLHTYGGWGRFFKALRQQKIMATRCSNPACAEKRLWLPPRCECPD